MGVVILALSIGVVLFILKSAVLYPITRHISSSVLLFLIDSSVGYMYYRFTLTIRENTLVPLAMVSYGICCLILLAFEKLYSLLRRYYPNDG